MTVTGSIEFSDILAALAIVCSLYTFYRTNKMTKKIANKTLAKEFFEAVFLEFMIKTLPEKILLPLEMKNGAIQATAEEIEQTIMDILGKANPYRYFNSQLYQDFYVAMSELEECIFKLIQSQTSGNLTDSLYERVRGDIDSLCEGIYDMLKKEFMC